MRNLTEASLGLFRFYFRGIKASTEEREHTLFLNAGLRVAQEPIPVMGHCLSG